jgi:hypothetical protein
MDVILRSPDVERSTIWIDAHPFNLPLNVERSTIGDEAHPAQPPLSVERSTFAATLPFSGPSTHCRERRLWGALLDTDRLAASVVMNRSRSCKPQRSLPAPYTVILRFQNVERSTFALFDLQMLSAQHLP